MIETCKDCRHCERRTEERRVHSKKGARIEIVSFLWCERLKTETQPLYRCPYINEPKNEVRSPEIIYTE